MNRRVSPKYMTTFKVVMTFRKGDNLLCRLIYRFRVQYVRNLCHRHTSVTVDARVASVGHLTLVPDLRHLMPHQTASQARITIRLSAIPGSGISVPQAAACSRKAPFFD